MKLSGIIVLLLFLLVSQQAYAHTSESSGTITILMHPEPYDMPLTAQETTLHFQISDSSNKFKISECNCSAKIYLGNQLLIIQRIKELKSDKSLYNAYITFRFPRSGEFRVLLIGNPKKETFHKFQAHFDLNVGKNSKKKQSSNSLTLFTTYVILSIIGISTIALLFRQIFNSNHK